MKKHAERNGFAHIRIGREAANQQPEARRLERHAPRAAGFAAIQRLTAVRQPGTMTLIPCGVIRHPRRRFHARR